MEVRVLLGSLRIINMICLPFFTRSDGNSKYCHGDYSVEDSNDQPVWLVYFCGQLIHDYCKSLLHAKSVITDHKEIMGRPEYEPHGWMLGEKFALNIDILDAEEWTGKHSEDGPIMEPHPLYTGDHVKVTMVSRFGDCGITDNLSAKFGYISRVDPTELSPLHDSKCASCHSSDVIRRIEWGELEVDNSVVEYPATVSDCRSCGGSSPDERNRCIINFVKGQRNRLKQELNYKIRKFGKIQKNS